MKLIALNLWGGKIYEPLIEFVKSQAEGVDIFCFQDVLFGDKPEFTEIDKGRINIFREIKDILSDFDYSIFQSPGESHFHSEYLDPSIGCGQVIFVRKSLPILENGGLRSGESDYFQGGGLVSGKHHWIKFQANGENYTIMNVHGMYQRGTQKGDTPERILQSENIKNFFASVKGKKILCGDFNLIPDGQAVKILEENMVNLISKFGITSTRNSYYPKPGKFADYVFVSPDIEVKEFKVLQDEISDHSPLYLEFE